MPPSNRLCQDLADDPDTAAVARTILRFDDDFHVVAEGKSISLRGRLRRGGPPRERFVKPAKVEHLGTLDPFATGLLPYRLAAAVPHPHLENLQQRCYCTVSAVLKELAIWAKRRRQPFQGLREANPSRSDWSSE